MKYRSLNTTEMRALENHAAEKYGVSFSQMMQSAGKAIFDVVMNEIRPDKVSVVAGKGNNGGDALVAARLLREKEIELIVFSPYPLDEFSPMARTEMKRIQKMNIQVADDPWKLKSYNLNLKSDLIIDALFGFSLKGNPRPPADKIIEQINCSGIPVLSVDVPSGLDVHTGSLGHPTVKADYTVALGMPKKGFEEHPDYVGKLSLGDLGIPPQAYRDQGLDPPLFQGKSYLAFH